MSKRQRLPITIGIIGLAIVAALAWWLLLAVNKPGVKEYTAAQDASQTTLTTFSEYEASFNTYVAGKADSAANTAQYKKAHSAYTAKVNNLEKAVAKLDNQTLTKDYQAFKAKSDAFVDYAEGYVKDYAVAERLMGADCLKTERLLSGTTDTFLKQYDERAQKCQADIAALKKSSNDGLAQYANAVSDVIAERRTALAAAQADLKSGNAAAIQKALVGVLTIKTPDLIKELSDARMKAGVLQEFQAFHNALTEKAVEITKNEKAK